MAVVHRLAVVMRKWPSSAGEEEDEDFLVVRQTPPPALLEEEYRSQVDSDLFDIPSAVLKPLDGDRRSEIAVDGADECSDKIDLGSFDLEAALLEVQSQVGNVAAVIGNWALLKYIEEADFGPEPLIHTVFILGRLESESGYLHEPCKWMSVKRASDLLWEVKPGSDRVGSAMFIGLMPESAKSTKWKPQHALRYQEYPPGITIIPMMSRTIKPFCTTNLVVVIPEKVSDGLEETSYFANGDALIVDPGCCSQVHAELADLITALPRKLLVYVTHHHHDHVDGLSVVQKFNPDAILLAHENTMARIGKDNWSRGFTLISGGERICIGGQPLEAVFAPGHTDGHLGLLHISTNALIVGDHCVGQGTAVLDVTAGGSMKDYFQTTNQFLELSPHVLIPMHGRINMWPKRMLCGYLKHRRDRELSVLNAIESGAKTLYDIVSKLYADLDLKLWFAASWNVRLHVDHLASQDKLPKDFSMRKFKTTSGLHFVSGVVWQYLKRRRFTAAKLLAVVSFTGLAISIASKLMLVS